MTYIRTPECLEHFDKHGTEAARVHQGGTPMSDRPSRYGMILLDTDPAILRVRGQPMIFRSADETLEYARLHGITRWMVYGDPEGWWPLYTQAGPIHPPPPPKDRVDISLHR